MFKEELEVRVQSINDTTLLPLVKQAVEADTVEILEMEVKISRIVRLESYTDFQGRHGFTRSKYRGPYF